jgi:THO complex subunit 3
MKGHTGDVSYIKWDPTHPERLVSCSATAGSAGVDRGLYFWDIRQGKPTSVIQTHGENINLAWSPDGKTVVVGTRNDVVSFIDVEAGKVIREDKNKQEVAFRLESSVDRMETDSMIILDERIHFLAYWNIPVNCRGL